MKKISLGDLAVRVSTPKEISHKEPIVFVHGMWGGAWYWEPFMEYFADLGYVSYALDLRGHHGSPSSVRLGRVSIYDYVADVEALIAHIQKETKAEQVILVGHSMGGLIAQKVAEGSRDIARLVLISPAPPASVFLLPSFSLLSRLIAPDIPLKESRRTPWGSIAATTARNMRMVAVLARVVFDRKFLAGFRVVKHTLKYFPERERREVYEKLVPESGRAAIEILGRRIHVDPKRLSAPVYVIGADDDNVILSYVSHRVAKKYGGQFTSFPKHGHFLIIEPGWEDVARSMSDWLK